MSYLSKRQPSRDRYCANILILNTMKIFLHHFKLHTVLLFLILVGFGGSAYGQTIGDYRTVGSGAWTTLSTWERWDGAAWVTPTAIVTEGYPGENNVTQRVFIANGHAITLSTTPPNSAAITRLEFLTSVGVAATSLTLSGGNLTITGDIVTEESAGNNTISVGANTLTCQQMRLTNLLGATDVSEINVTTGVVNLTTSSSNLQIQQTTLGGGRCFFRFTGAGTLNLKGSITGNGDLVAGTGTVAFNDTGAITIPAYAYYNLTLSGASGLKTVATGTTIAFNLNLATAAAGTISFAAATNVRAITSVLGAAGGGGETWGPSGSTPDNVDPVFQAASNRVTVNGIANDYRSNGSGNWNNVATWQRFDGTNWVAPGANGYPGELNVVTSRVYIRNGHAITTSAVLPNAARVSRLEFVGTSKTAATSLTLGANLTITGAVVGEESAGNNTIVVSTFTLSCQQMRLTNLLGTTDVSEINVTTGTVTCSTGSLQLQQTALGAARSIFRCTGAGNLNIFGTITGNGDIIPGTGRVTLNGTAPNIIVPANAFFNLTLSGAVTTPFLKILSPGTTIANNFTITGTAIAGLPNGSTYNVLSLTLGAAAQLALPSTYGSTASAAGTTNNTYFDVATTGIVKANPPTGDYRSVANGNWSTLATWERYNGTAWVTPTTAVTEGYPGQYAVANRVFIGDNTSVTGDVSISGTPNRPTRLEFTPNANDAVLNINPGVNLGIDGPVALASPGAGANTGDAILNVGSGTLSVQGLLRLNDTQGPNNDCILRIGTGTVTVSGTDARMLGAVDENLIIFDGAGTLSTNGTAAVALAGAGTFTAGTGTVIFNLSGVQTLPAYTFYNVVLQGTSLKTFVAGTTITNSLTIAGTASAGLPNASNYTIPSLIYGTAGQLAGTYGSTASAATLANRSDTIYNVVTTGIITVASNIPVVTPTIGTYTYTGLPQGPIAATNSGTGTTYTFSYTNNGGTPYGPTATLPTNAGNYFVTVTVAANGAWLENSSAAIGFRIAQRALSITASSSTKQFGSTILTGSGSYFFTPTGLQNGETIGSITFNSIGAEAGAAVGTYPTVPTAAVGGTFNAANYTITYANGTLTVAAPTAGNYRSKASGDWTTLATWERWNGSSWVEPTSVEGYPAEKANVTRVDILNSHNISCGVNFYTTTFRPGRIEVAAGANDTSLTFSSSYIDLSSALVLTSVGGGNALVNVANTTIYSTGTLSLGLPVGGGTCKVIINNGSVNFGSNIAMAGNAAQNSIEFTGSGTMTSSGGTISGGTIVAGTGTVQYTSNTAQTIGAYTFNNLYLSSASTFTKTLNASTIINGNLTIANSAVASLAAATNYTIDSLVLGGVGRVAGTWGHTNSSPTNINDTFFAATTGYLTVGKSAPDVTPTIGTYVYNGTAQGPNTATNTGTGTSYTFTYRGVAPTVYSASATAPTNVGNYTVTATVAADGSFAARSSAATAFAITTAALTITANNATKIIGTTYTVGAGSTAFTSSGLQGIETIGSITIASTGAVSTAALGSYTIVPSAATGGTFTASNYTITYNITTPGLLTVNPNAGDYRTKASGDWTTLATWERWNGTAWVEPTVGEGYPTQNAAVLRLDILNSHNITCGIGTGSNYVGRLTITAGANNTSLTFTSSLYFQLEGNAPIVLSSTGAGNALLDVGNASIYSFSQLQMGIPSSTGICKVIINNGSLNLAGNLTMSGSAAQNIIQFDGSGTLTISGSTSGTGSTISGGTIVAGTGTVQYTTYNAAQNVGAYTFSNLYLSSTSTFTKTLNAGTIINGNLTVANAAVVSLASGVNYTVDSLILGTTGSASGTWGSTTSIATNPNNTYFAATTGYLTVGKSAPDVTPTIGTYVYNGAAQGPNTATNTGTGTSYTFSYRNSGGTSYGPTATAPTNAGNYTVTVTVAADGSFAARSSAATAFAITTAALTITANNASKIIGATFTTGAGSTAFTPIGLQNSETIGTVTIASSGAVSSAALGTYTITPSAAVGGTFVASNYTITYATGTLTVNPNGGDYRTKASGDWTTLATWERWDGTAWIEPTVGEGYPSQHTFPTRVNILNSHNVTCGIGVTGTNRPRRIEVAAGASNTSLTFTSSNYFEISGSLVLTATGAGSAFVNVNAAYLGVTDAVSLANTPSSATDCEVVITTGALYVFNDGNLTMNGAADENAIRVGSGFLSCAGNITGGTIVAGTGTVEYNGAAQTVGAYNFYNLILSGTLTKTLNAATVIAENLTIADTAIASLNAGTTYTVNSLIYGTAGQPQGTYGSTTSAATNKNDTYFASTGILDVTLSTPDITVTIDSYIYTGTPQGPNTASNTGTGEIYTFSYRSNGGTAYTTSPTPPTNVGNYFVTVTVAAHGSYASRRLVDTAFSISRRGLAVTANNGTKELGTTYTTGSGSTLFTQIGLQNSETIGSVTIASTGAVSTAALGTYPIVASAATGGTFTASNYTITYTDGTLTVVQNTGDYRSKSSGDWTTLTTWERWDGSVWIEPTIAQGYPCQNASPFRVDISNGHAVTCGIGISTNRLTRLEVAAGANDTSLTFTASTYFETLGNIVVTAAGAGNAILDVGNSTLVSTAGILRLNNVVSPAPANSKVIINNGTLTSSGSNLQMVGDAAKTSIEFTGAGLLRTAGTTINAISGGTIIPGAGTVEFMGAAQTVGAYNFNNLTLSGSGIKTVDALTNITGNVRIAGTAVASLNAGTTYNVDTLTLDCDGTVNGTWGSTTSSATNTNNTYFAATTGMLNVATNSTVNPLAVIAVVQPTCTTSTGTVTVTVQIITDTYSFDNGLTYQASNVKSGLAVGSYNVIIKHRSGCLSPTTVATLSSPTKTWNGSANSDWNNDANWTPSGVPVATNCIVVPDVTNDLIINGTNFTASLYSLTVANGVTVTVEPTNSLKVIDFINVNAGGTLMVQNNANLVQVNNATNTGNIIYQRTPPTQVIETDYIYWSSPVSGMTLAGVSPGDYIGGYFYSFDSTADNWTDIPINTTMVPGLGYIMRGQKPHNNLFTVNATFTGVPNNGLINAPTGLDGNSALLGNPYPSAIDADKFLLENISKIEGTLYFWTHNTKVLNNVYTAGDYASYNGTGGTETLPAASGGNAPTGKIAACQSFFATSLGAGDAAFTNDMRLVGGIPLDNTNFYKTKDQKSARAIEKHRIWLNLTNTKGAFKQLLIGYVSDATNEYDSRFDGKSFDGNEYVDFYSVNNNKNLTIQGRALPFDDNDEVPLGYRSAIIGEFSIGIDAVDGLIANQAVFLEDKLTNSIVNLKTSKYLFATTVGVFNDRFVLRFKDKTLGTNDLLSQSHKVLVSIKNKQIKINSFSENIDKVAIYDLLGRQIYQKTKVSSNELILSNFVSGNQTLLVKTTLQNGSVVTEKVIY